MSQAMTNFQHAADFTIGATFKQLAKALGANHVTLIADEANTATIYWGNKDTVTAGAAADTTGSPLGPGDSFTVKTDDASDIFVISSGAADKKLYWVVT